MDQPSATVANGGEEEEPSAPPRGPSAHLRDTLLTTQRKMEGLVAAHERATAAHARTSASWPAVGNAVGAAARGIPRQGASYALTAPVAAAAAAASSSSAPLSGVPHAPWSNATVFLHQILTSYSYEYSLAYNAANGRIFARCTFRSHGRPLSFAPEALVPQKLITLK